MVQYGIKSFEHPLDRLENRCVRTLNLVPEFDERVIREEAAWRDKVVPQLQQFLVGMPATEGRVRLAMEAHASLAFAAGAILNTKSGRLVEMEQRSPIPKVWAPDDAPLTQDLCGWQFAEVALDADGAGTAFAVSLTRDTGAAVRRFIGDSRLKLRRLVLAAPKKGPAATAVVSGAHANWLAEELATWIKRDRETNCQVVRERSHLFISAPNAFTFFLGRQTAVMSPLTLYEFDFANQVDGSYRPSLSYPEIAKTAA
jgi:hypothetical protein